MGNDRYDVIIVGAGPAGSSAAYFCAKNNLSVALMERGDFPGSKNMFGGVIYSKPTSIIIPGFWEKAPLERAVTRYILWLMETDSVVEMGFTGFNFAKPPYNTFTVIRSRFDRWFAEQAITAGSHLMTSTLVEALIYKKSGLNQKQVTGVILEDGSKIYADLIILAEGAMADLTHKAGMRQKITADMLTIYVKELLYLPKEIIEARFNLEKNEGAVIGMIGYPTAGAIGKGGIWTNNDTISLTVGGYLNQLNKKGLNPYQLLQRLKKHPKVINLIDGAKTIQYQSHIIPKGGYKSIPKFYNNGILITGDAGMLISGRHGTDIAMLSGKHAAETVIEAKTKGDFTKKILAGYELKLKNSFFMKNMKDNQKRGSYYKNHPDSDYLISQFINKAAYKYFREEMENQNKKIEEILTQLKTMQPISKSITDFYQGLWNWRVF
ncbi:MAG: FAD-dependent oxidoreductase [Firmicutes bacterium]|nr:FAD-dependent oxidoreductase [Bacillota bacterium]